MNKETVGSRLKKARLRKNLTLNDAYRDLKIQPRILDALENDCIDPDLGDVYIKAFLRRYAGYLGLSGDSMLSDLSDKPQLSGKKEDVYIQVGGQKKTPVIIKDRFRKSALPLTAAIALLVVVYVIGCAVLGIKREVKRFSSKTAAAVIARKQSVPPKSYSGTAPEPIKIGKEEPLSLKIETKDKVWLRVKSDGKVIFEHTLPAGSVENWKAQDELELWIGRAEALNFTLNGKKIDSPGKGRIRKLVIDRKGIRVEQK